MPSYYDLLKNPLWQKKRLKIMERDNWTCRYCFQESNTLTIHHKKYLPNSKPWEYRDDDLITLCEFCHRCHNCAYFEHDFCTVRDQWDIKNDTGKCTDWKLQVNRCNKN